MPGLIPPPYRGPTDGEGELVEARPCAPRIEAVERKFPASLRGARRPGKVHRFVKLFVNGEPVDAKRLDRAVEAGDELEIVSAIAGG
jgi:hypothetical protein